MEAGPVLVLRETRLDADRYRRLFPPLAFYSWLATTAIAAISGPFGTFQALDFPQRLLFWAVILGVSIAAGRMLRVVVEDRFEGQPVWRMELVSIIVIVPILSALIWVLMPQILPFPRDRLPGPGVVSGYVFLIAGTVAAFRRARLLVGDERLTQAPRAHPRLLQRLPQEVQSDILRLSSSDHMVEVVTTRGATPIRMRFGDAIDEMEPIVGYCVHRSHWVTRSAIAEVERDAGKLFLRLSNGERVPVSRKYRPNLEDAGIV